MNKYRVNTKINKKILALGAESAGNFSVFDNGVIFHSEDFGDMQDEKKFIKLKKSILLFLKNENIIPDIIVTDIHPHYKTTIWGERMSKKFKAEHLQVQHHLAHIFSQLENKPPINYFFGIAMDGTGYGIDKKIWGGEVFEVKSEKSEVRINRIGHLENQVLIGGELAIREPARLLISILNNFLNKKDVFDYLKIYYTKNEFELLYNQLKQNFNCVETSSTGRILDAVSVLLGFSKNERNFKHGPAYLLEENSTKPYSLKPQIEKNNDICILKTTSLFEFLIKNFHRDKKRLAATAQQYIASGLYGIVAESINAKPVGNQKIYKSDIFFAGGITDNKIISSYLRSKQATANKKIPRGDAGISFGQINYYLLTNPRD